MIKSQAFLCGVGLHHSSKLSTESESPRIVLIPVHLIFVAQNTNISLPQRDFMEEKMCTVVAHSEIVMKVINLVDEDFHTHLVK